RRPFGATWWGRAWVEALEGRARLDPNRLPRGRTYARTGAVGTLDIAPGEVRAEVQGSRAEPYEVTVRVRMFSPDEWRQVVEVLSSALGHLAALLDGELPPEVAGELASARLDLLPGAGEVQPRCSCPDWAEPCKHSAAACYLVADALDVDPFQLLLLRGQGRDELLAALRARRAASVSAGGTGTEDGRPPAFSPPKAPPSLEADPGVLAREVWARAAASAANAALPPVPLPPPRPGRPAVLAVDPPASSGLGAEALRMLAADAAGRAFELAHGGASSGLELSYREDLARRAASLLDEGPVGVARLAEVAARVALSGRELMRWALAWRSGGAEGLYVLLESFEAAPELLAPGRALLAADADGTGAGDGMGARVTVWRNRVSRSDRQLRLGRDGRWYPYRRAGRASFEPDGPPIDAPVLEPLDYMASEP
ncbi:MAG: SWIM zinc finger family protein, partial [Acidimicrobiales bacterium]